MRRLLVRGGTLVALLGSGSAMLPIRVTAQNGATIPASCIMVQGNGTVSKKPDIARVTVGVQTDNRDPGRAAQSNATRAATIIRAIRALGIAEKDIQTSVYTVEPIYRDDAGKASPDSQTARLLGYRVSNNVRVTLRKITDTGRMIDAATKAGANSVADLSYDLNEADLQKAKDEALRLSVVDANRKAILLARAANAGQLTLDTITEANAENAEMNAVIRNNYAPGVAATPVTPIVTGQQTITASVVVRYRIAPGADPQTGNPAYSAGGGK